MFREIKLKVINMTKKTIGMTMALLVCIPLCSLADITINAPAQNGGWAILYNPNDASVYNQVQFSGGIATLDTTGIVGFTTPWAIDLTYDSGKQWQSRVYWKNGATYSPVQTGWSAGASMTITSVVGQVVNRTYDVSNMAKRTMSVRYQAAMSGVLTLDMLNNNTHQLDANLRVFRPAQDNIADFGASVSAKKSWDPATLGGPFSWSVTGTAPNSGLDIIEITNGSDFLANYLGSWNTANNAYDLYFTVADDPGDTAYWSTYNNDGNSELGVVTESNGDVTFTATSIGALTLQTGVPYYVQMDRSMNFDDGTTPNSLTSGFDANIVLTNPDHYVIPEPAVITLILGGACSLLIGRRLFSGVNV